jgi:flagellar biosynthetic protein FliP
MMRLMMQKSTLDARCSTSGTEGLSAAAAGRPRSKVNGQGLLLLLSLLLAPMLSFAAPGLDAVTVTTNPNGGQTYSLTLQILILMTAVTLLPAIVLMMTSFTRIVIVLAILRQALGAGQSPPNQVIVGLSLFLTLFVMGPVIDRVNTEAVQPYMAGTIDANVAMERGVIPLKKFMLDQTRESDISTFVRISGGQGFDKPEDVPMRILVPAFATSELKTAFQIGFLIFIPFVIIDLVVASVLMSMGMMMLSPVLISLPFKLMLFVLVDGWALVMGTLAASFYT